MREIFLDTETSGMSVENGCVVIEIGCVEYINQQKTGNVFHVLLNPAGATWEEEAQNVHGHTLSSLVNQPLFKHIVDDFIQFVKGAKIIIHNAPFDLKFLNAELTKIGKKTLDHYASEIEDSLIRAKSLFPKKRVNLNTLCDTLSVSREQRVYHGALIDAELLGEVYYRMNMNAPAFINDYSVGLQSRPPVVPIQRSTQTLLTISPQEQHQHQLLLEDLAKNTKKELIWTQTNKTPKKLTT